MRAILIYIRPLTVLACSLALAVASVYVAMWLFTLNAPQANEKAQSGWGFNLYASLVAGGIVGSLSAAIAMARNPDACCWFGGVMVTLLAAAMPLLSRNDRWEGPDLLALPIAASAVLLGWGFLARGNVR